MRPDRTRIVQEGLFKEDPGGLPGTGHSGAGLCDHLPTVNYDAPHSAGSSLARPAGRRPRIPLSLWRRPLSPFVTLIKAGR